MSDPSVREAAVLESVWLTITGGQQPDPNEYDFTPDEAPSDAATITPAQAVAAAVAAAPGEVSWVGLPSEDYPYYEIDTISSTAPYAHRAVYRGDQIVYVDPHDASHLTVGGSTEGRNASTRFYEKIFEPAHFGWDVGPWWRLIWFVLGMTPLVLMVTALSTWLFRYGVKRRRRRARAA